MALISYQNKVALSENPSIPNINKVTDDDMNEIKNVVNSNETKVLLAVSASAPAQCSSGDMYFNTSTKLIYTATGTNTWGTTGVAPTSNTIYIVLSEQGTYAYDGTTLVSVGGGSGAYIGTTQPPADDNSNIWVNPDESVNVYGNYISNQYGTSQEIGYAQEYVNTLNEQNIKLITPAGSARKITGIGLDYHNNKWALRIDSVVDGIDYTQWFYDDDGTLN